MLDGGSGVGEIPQEVGNGVHDLLAEGKELFGVRAVFRVLPVMACGAVVVSVGCRGVILASAANALLHTFAVRHVVGDCVGEEFRER